jgi:hypothetical protein
MPPSMKLQELSVFSGHTSGMGSNTFLVAILHTYDNDHFTVEASFRLSEGLPCSLPQFRSIAKVRWSPSR